jgi:hypothetical protein
VVSPEETWSEKIILDHAELIDNEPSIEQTLIDPDEVQFDRDYADREVYYRRGALPSPYDRDYLKIVVAFSRTESGEAWGRVVTAYAVDRVKAGERLKWKRWMGIR